MINQEIKKQLSIHSPNFEFKDTIDLFGTGWGGHFYFAYDLISLIKPKVIVELGSHYGHSFFSFAQAVKDSKLNTALHAVDTWEGDEHAGKYNEEVFNKFNEVISKHYKDINITAHKQLFDDAVNNFSDRSIDLLHIDGLHTYEAVKHDFEIWLPKMREDGIILLHDISVREDDFGVYKLWKELKNKYHTAEFHHSHGLGIVFLSGKNVFNLEEVFKQYYLNKFENEYNKYILKIKEKVINSNISISNEKDIVIKDLGTERDSLQIKLEEVKNEIKEKEKYFVDESREKTMKIEQLLKNEKQNKEKYEKDREEYEKKVETLSNKLKEKQLELRGIFHETHSLNSQIEILENTQEALYLELQRLKDKISFLENYIDNIRLRKLIKIYNKYLEKRGKNKI